MPHLFEALRDGLHDAIEMSREQLQASRVEQQSALAAGLRACGAASLGMGELLVLAEDGDVLRREAQAVVGDRRGGRGGLRRGASILLLSLAVAVMMVVGGGRVVRRGRHSSIDHGGQRHCMTTAGTAWTPSPHGVAEVGQVRRK